MIKFKPRGFYLNQFNVEYRSHNEIKFDYISRKELDTLKAQTGIQIVRIKQLKFKKDDFFYEEVYNINRGLER